MKKVTHLEQNKEWLNKKIGNYLQQLRKNAGMSQGDAASALNYTSNQFISNIERGVCTPSPSIIHKLLETYNVSGSKAVEDLLEIQLKFLSAEFKGKKIK